MASLLENADRALLENGDVSLLESDGGGVTGTVAVTEEEEALAAAGTAYTSITGTVAVTEEEEALAAVGTASAAPEYSHTWTGTNGASWSADWTTSNNGTAGTIDIQSNRGRMVTAAVSSNTQRAVLGASLWDQADGEALVDFEVITDNEFWNATVALRSSGTWSTGDSNMPADGYVVRLDGDTNLVKFFKIVANTATQLGTDQSFTLTFGVNYRIRFRVQGSVIKAKIWDSTGSEPGAWTYEQTDGSITDAGQFMLAFRSSLALDARWDNLSLDDLFGNNTADLNESDDTVVAAGHATVSGTSAITEGEDVLASAGTFTSTITGTVAVTEDDDTMAATGDLTASDYTYNFTGTNGAAWAAEWATSNNGSGGTIDIQSNKGRMLTTTTSLNSQRAILAASNFSTIDSEAVIEFTPGGNFGREILILRGSGVWSAGESQDPTNGYCVQLDDALSRLSFHKVVASVGTQIGSNQTFSFTDTVTYRVRFRVVGTAIKVRVWDIAGAEPGAWTYEQTDGSITDAGQFMLVFRNNGAAIQDVLWDNLTLEDLTAITGTVAVTEEEDTVVGSGSDRWRRRGRVIRIPPARLRPRVAIGYGIGGDTNILGIANITEEEDTLTAAGAVTIIGAAVLTEEEDATTAAGTFTITGSAAVTEEADTLIAGANQTIVGTVAVTEEEDTADATGAFTTTGSAALTEEGDTAAAHGTGMGLVLVMRNVSIPEMLPAPRVFSWRLRQRFTLNATGTAAVTEEADALVATGDQSIPGSAALVEEDDTLAGAGTFTLAAVTGTAAVTEQLDVLAAEGAQPVEALAFLVEDDDTATASGTYSLATITGTAALVESEDTLSAAGTSVPPSITGTASLVEEEDTAVATGTFTITGTASLVEEADTAVAAGTFTITGTAALVEEADTAVVVGNQSTPGTAALVEEEDTAVATGTFTITGTTALVEEADTAVAVGTAYVVIFGAVIMTEEDDSTSASGTAVSLVFGVALITEEDDVTTSILFTYTFEPPRDESGPRKLSETGRRRQGITHMANELAGRYGAPRSFSVLKLNGTYVQIEGPDMDQVNAATEYYAGGHIHEVTHTQALALQAAGFDVDGI